MKCDWNRRLEGFKGSDSISNIRFPATSTSINEKCSPSNLTIHWSSSDEETEASSSKKPLVVVRLNFEEGVQGSSGHVKPRISRHLIKKSRTSSSATFNSTVDNNFDAGSAAEISTDVPVVTPPRSPIIGRRRRVIKQQQMSPRPSEYPDTPRPTSPVLCATRKRRRITTECELRTPRPPSPVLSRNKNKIKQPSPILSKHNRRKLAPFSSSVKLNLTESFDATRTSVQIDDTQAVHSQCVSLVHTQNVTRYCSARSQKNSTPAVQNDIPSNLDDSQEIINIDTHQITRERALDAMSCPQITQVASQWKSYDDSQDMQIDDSSQSLTMPSIDVSSSQESVAVEHSSNRVTWMAGIENEEFNIAELPPSLPSSPTTSSTETYVVNSSRKYRTQRWPREVLFWKMHRLLIQPHEQDNGTVYSTSYGQHLKVQSVKFERGKMIAHCRFLSTNEKAVLHFFREQPSKTMKLVSYDKNIVRPGTHVTIYPPEQQSDCRSLGIPVLVGRNLEQEHPKGRNAMDHAKPSSCEPTSTQSKRNCTIRQYTCPCRQDPAVPSNQCSFKLPGDLLRILFSPNEEHNQTPSSCHVVQNSMDRELTIATAVTSHASNLASPLQLILCCQRLCCYRLPSSLAGFQSQSNDTQSSCTSHDDSRRCWQVLGQDSQGNICIVELGKHYDPLVEGSVVHFQHLSITKRLQISRSPGLQSFLSSINPQHSQSVIYLFSNSRSQSSQLIEKCPVSTWIAPNISTQTDIFSQEDCRVTLIGRVIYLHNSELLYIQPVMWHPSEGPNYLRITVRPWGYLSNTISSTSTLLCLRDLCALGGELFIDRYSAVINVQEVPACQKTPWMMNLLSKKFPSQTVTFTHPNDESIVGDLVTVQGTIKDVDESLACVWPVCSACSSEILQEAPGSEDSLQCVVCGSKGPFPNRASLTVELDLPGCVKVKLQQSTIRKLLPGVEHSSESYQLESVLGHPLEPITCIISEKSGSDLNLTEIPGSNQ